MNLPQLIDSVIKGDWTTTKFLVIINKSCQEQPQTFFMHIYVYLWVISSAFLDTDIFPKWLCHFALPPADTRIAVALQPCPNLALM